MSEPQVLRFEEIRTVARGGGVTTKPLAGSWIGTQGFTSGITTFPVGAAIKLHTHNVEETVTILEGDARCEIDGNSYNLQRLDTTYVPVGVPHRFVNVGQSKIRILWTYATTFITRTFVDTGETVEHLSGNDLAGGK
ncbi:MAG: cupin domain-containing protein [Chloroflexota bacterium]